MAAAAAAAAVAEEAARQRVPFRAEAGSGKVAGRRGAAPRRAARATSSRGPASEDQPWTTSVSAGGGGRSGRGPAAADPTLAPGWAAVPAARDCAGRSSLRRRRIPIPYWGSGTFLRKRRPAPRADLLSCGTLTSLPHPHLRAAAYRTRSQRQFPSMSPFCPLQATSHFADCPPPPLQGSSPFRESPPASYHSPQKSL